MKVIGRRARMRSTKADHAPCLISPSLADLLLALLTRESNVNII